MNCDEKETAQDQAGGDRPSFFGERDELLRMLGFECYADYLASDLWEFVRGSLKPIRECLVCKSSTGLAWHHRTYAMPVLVGNFSDFSEPIVRLCSQCHRAIHQRGGDWIDGMDDVERRLQILQSTFHACEGNRDAALFDTSPDWSDFV